MPESAKPCSDSLLVEAVEAWIDNANRTSLTREAVNFIFELSSGAKESSKKRAVVVVVFFLSFFFFAFLFIYYSMYVSMPVSHFKLFRFKECYTDFFFIHALFT